MEEKKKSGILIGLIVVIAVIACAMAALFFKQKAENDDMLQLFEIEKEEMENEYSGYAVQYDELRVQISNDSLIHQLEREKLRTQQLLEELRQTKASNAAEITRLKKELATVRAVMRNYVAQIDSLDKLNKKLAQENTQVRQQYREATKSIDKLTQEKQIAEEKVALASQLDAVGIVVSPRNKRGKSENKVKNVTQIAIDFTLAKNITTKTGEKTVYIRIMKPDGDILTKDASATFPYENTSLGYSMKKYIEYTGEQQQVTMYWDVEEFLYAGEYGAYIFVDGVMIGEQSFTLN